MRSRLRAIRLVAMREILERGRSRGYVFSLLFTVILLVAGFVLPSILLGNEATPNLALVGTPPSGLEGSIVAIADQYDVTLDISTVPDQADGRSRAARQDDRRRAGRPVRPLRPRAS